VSLACNTFIAASKRPRF